MRIRISWPAGALDATLNDSSTSRKLAAALPVTSSAHTWGEEVYFSVPIESVLEEHPRQVVAPGTVCFWVQGASVAIPFGPTPISVGNECRLVTAVNVLGTLDGDRNALATVHDGDPIALEAAEPS
ncbi:MAG TPA: cyclophilin-like fold protein [Candidatus Hydrogenedentes bacterium]|jgi:hypothetical protein|nr:cyclophilin-like fold protein [FCB group bacterium]HNV22293.1 cyclophilin-like fold protein [Candidatus Hydrogenedentota bacterium]HNZ19884.1 cyclophilin-like fold protein [Candidatus Hydrogenedentota bacterium]HOH35837.1 cyclophilin-like fold protein [Candidatus Hydrogenedentota bacterium]HPA04827.1 cyclophilin-like fold protein [Candidatus Hydrogenedentota bacterium]